MLLSFWDSVGKTVLTALYAILLVIDGSIYSLLNKIYRIYIALASARLLTTGMFTEIANKFYAIIGVVMLFVMAYVVIQGIVNPDNFAKSGGEGSQILKRIGIAVLGLALVPGAFRIAYTGQDVLLNDNIVGKIFLGYDDESNKIEHDEIKLDKNTIEIDSDGDGKGDNGTINQNDAVVTSAGTVTSLSLWQAVFYPSNIDSDKAFDEAASKIETELPASSFIRGAQTLSRLACGIAVIGSIISLGAGLLATAAVCGAALAVEGISKLDGKVVNLSQAYGVAAATGNFSVFVGFAGKVASGDIEYKIFFSTIIGVVSAWLFTSFAIDMAVRAVKLVYMQIIAPVPLMLQILPKFKDNFQKWLKTVLSLFLEVFIRLTFVYIVAYLISHLWAIMSGGWLEKANLDVVEKFLAQVILIIGMLIFAKTAPQFISETLGIDSGNLNLGIRKKLAEGGIFSKAAAIGGIGANFLSGGFANAKNKWKESHRTDTEENRHRMLRKTRHVAAAAGGFITGGFGRAVRNAYPTIMDASKANNFLEVRDRVVDSYRRGQKEEAERKKKQDKRKGELAEKGYRPEENQHKGPIRWITNGRDYFNANLQRDKEKAFEFIADNFSALPPDVSRWEGKLKIQQDMKDAKKVAQEAAMEVNQNYKNAVNARALLDTEAGRQEAAKKVASQMLSRGEITGDQFKEITSSPEKMSQFMLQNSTAVNNQLLNDKLEADEKVKKAKEASVNEELARESIKGGGKVTDALRKYISDHADNIKKYGNEEITIKDGDTTRTMKYRDYLVSKFGADFESGVIDYHAILGDYESKVEREFKITGENGKEGTVRYRLEGEDGHKTMVGTFDDGTGPVRITSLENGELHLATGDPIKKVEMVKQGAGESVLKVFEEKGYETDENHKLKAGTMLEMAQQLGGTIEYTSTGGTQETLRVQKNSSGVLEGKVITGALPDVVTAKELGDSLQASQVIVDSGPAVQVTGKLDSGATVGLSLSSVNGEVQAKLDGQATSIPLSSSNINLANVAMQGSISLSDMAANLSLGEGSHALKLGGQDIEVQVSSGGSIASCNKVLLGPTALAADITTGAFGGELGHKIANKQAFIEVSSLGAALQSNGEQLQLVDAIDPTTGVQTKLTIMKNAAGIMEYTKTTLTKDPTTGAITEGPTEQLTEAQAQDEFRNRPTVNVEAIKTLTSANREARITVKDGSETKIIKTTSGGEVSVLGEAGAVTIETAVDNLEAGQSVSFNLPSNQGTVVVAKDASGNESYQVTTNSGTTTYTDKNAFTRSYDVKVDTSIIPDIISGADETKTISISNQSITVKNLSAANLATYGEGQEIIGGTQIAETAIDNNQEVSIALDSGGTIRVETIPGTKTPRYIYIDSRGASHPYDTKAAMEQANPDCLTAKVTKIKTLKQGTDTTKHFGQQMGDAGEATYQGVIKDSEYISEMKRMTSDNDKDKK